ncbi:hypothetical protein L596_004514 [Steinernema carpocapsae]|uniref:Uncharacterized protein n=1 Tax=Steinernema carpocapsae TaxID=34508 RepID=A0A4U8V066_STECR|nr:hypothetical protein L596_004514 [Steinernema carpocapsae]
MLPSALNLLVLTRHSTRIYLQLNCHRTPAKKSVEVTTSRVVRTEGALLPEPPWKSMKRLKGDRTKRLGNHINKTKASL